MRKKKNKEKRYLNTDSLILFFLETLDKNEKKFYSYSDLIYQITHIYRLKSEFSKEIIGCLIKEGFFKMVKIDNQVFFKKDFDAEKELLFKINKNKLEEFKRKINILKMRLRKDENI